MKKLPKIYQNEITKKINNNNNKKSIIVFRKSSITIFEFLRK